MFTFLLDLASSFYKSSPDTVIFTGDLLCVPQRVWQKMVEGRRPGIYRYCRV